MSDKLEKQFNETKNLNDTEGALHVEEINFVDGETKVVVNAKLFLDMNKDTATLASQIDDNYKFGIFGLIY